MYRPAIVSAKPVRRYWLGNHEAVLVSDVIAHGSIRYAFVLAVKRDAEQEPCLYVTLELNNTATSADDTHFLCLFDEGMHGNLGPTSALTDLDAFAARALAWLENRLGCAAVPVAT